MLCSDNAGLGSARIAFQSYMTHTICSASALFYVMLLTIAVRPVNMQSIDSWTSVEPSVAQIWPVKTGRPARTMLEFDSTATDGIKHHQAIDTQDSHPVYRTFQKRSDFVPSRPVLGVDQRNSFVVGLGNFKEHCDESSLTCF